MSFGLTSNSFVTFLDNKRDIKGTYSAFCFFGFFGEILRFFVLLCLNPGIFLSQIHHNQELFCPWGDIYEARKTSWVTDDPRESSSSNDWATQTFSWRLRSSWCKALRLRSSHHRKQIKSFRNLLMPVSVLARAKSQTFIFHSIIRILVLWHSI